MPSTMRPATLELTPSIVDPSGQQPGPLIVWIPGNVLSSEISMRSLGAELPGRGRVLVVEHPRRGAFSFQQEAEQIAREVQRLGATKLAVIGVSMGSVVATHMIDALRQRRYLAALQQGGIISECGPTEPADIKGPIKYWWLWRHPRFLNRPAMWLFNRNPNFYIEDGVDWDLIHEHWRHQWYYPNSGRRGQLRALATMPPLRPEQYAADHIPGRYIRSLVDPLIELGAAKKFADGLGLDPEKCVIDTRGWHSAHPEQPRTWNLLTLRALDDLGFRPLAA